MIKYVERISGCGHNGPAWIARVRLSRSGTTVYFNGKALKRRNGIIGNHYDLRTGDEYWVSGVKKRGTNRHWAGSGKIMIEQSALAEYQRLIGKTSLDFSRYQVIGDLSQGDPAGLHEL